MLKAAAIGAIGLYAFSMLDSKVGITAKLPASLQQFAWVLPGAAVGIAVKKWG